MTTDYLRWFDEDELATGIRFLADENDATEKLDNLVAMVKQARTELAALREQLAAFDRAAMSYKETTSRDLATARALLARALDWEHGNHENPDADYWVPDVAAFLARDEATNPVGDMTKNPGDEARVCKHGTDLTGQPGAGCRDCHRESRGATGFIPRDEARGAPECTCFGRPEVTASYHAPDCPARALLARDEALRPPEEVRMTWVGKLSPDGKWIDPVGEPAPGKVGPVADGDEEFRDLNKNPRGTTKT